MHSDFWDIRKMEMIRENRGMRKMKYLFGSKKRCYALKLKNNGTILLKKRKRKCTVGRNSILNHS